MKNRLYRLAAVVLTVGGCLSCTDMNEVVFDQLEGEKYYENFTEKDIPSIIGPIYSDMRGLYAGWNVHKDGCWFYTGEETADIQISPHRGSAWLDGGIFQRLNDHTWNVDDKLVLGPWRSFYAGVNTANRLIFQFSSSDIKIDDNMRRSILSELRVARAFWYYCLIDFYGNVPLVTRYDVPKGYLPETTPRKEVYQFVVDEITESIPDLEESGYCRWNHYSASTLLARVYLNSCVWNPDGDQNAAYQKVDSLCKVVMNAGVYFLENDYKDVFKTENENSPEIIMAVANDEKYHEPNPFLPHLWSLHWKSYSHLKTETKFWGGMCADPTFIDTYDKDDLRLGKSWLMGQQYDYFGDFGPKGDKLYCDPWRPKEDGVPLNYSKNFTPDENGVGEQEGYRMCKYEIKAGAKSSLSNDFVLFRLADVYFMRAEALWRKNNKTATPIVVELINEVRSRAFADFKSDKKLKASQLDDERFVREYGWEFCQEGSRRQQLIRFGVFNTRTWSFHTVGSANTRALFPIPYEERLANPKLEQNPGY